MLLCVLCLLLACLSLTQGKQLYISCKPCVCRVTPNGKLIANCKGKHLSNIPKQIPNSVSYLCLSHNSIKHLPGGSFQRFSALERLDLSFNQLKRLDVHTFAGATNLLHLNLNGNHLQLNESAYPEGIFREQKLLTLNIANNNKIADSVYPDKALGDLTALQRLFIDGVRNASFGTGFLKLKNLTTLSLSGKRGHCSVQTLLNTSFLYTPSVRNLDISKCRINYIEASAFWPLRQIDTLDVSDNQYLGFDRMGEAIYGLQGNSSLRVLKINRIRHNPLPKPLPSSEPQPMVQYSHNSIHACEQCEAHCSNGLSYRNHHNSPYNDAKNDQTSILGLVFHIPLPPNATYVNVSNSKLNYDIVELNFLTNQFKTIDISHNVFPNWIGPINESQTFEYLDLSDNYCKYVSHRFFMYADGLKVLNISRNYLSVSLLADTNGQIFGNQTNLEVIRISHNLIRELPSLIFRRLTRLEVIDLSWNMMASWNIEIRHMPHLHTLDISGNRYEGIPTHLTNQIDYIMSNRNDTFHLSIKGNILKCDCSTLESLEWITRPFISIEDPGSTKCTLSDGETISFIDIENVKAKLQVRCKIVIPLL
ncbi:LOW QUALITY PROTEIN: slit homolog 3 protein-like, partial [Haliotis rubra]|uniref:LOW QUALITY PROTEIN: slit homolog 3 protein-like n=1 Tax=Haliotis rubra TaxID=36100 RepID=UPI001EE5DEB6